MTLSKTHYWTVGAVLLSLLALTRSGHLGTPVDLPDASWAIFFLAGFYLRSLRWFPVFMLAAWLIDLAAVRYAGVDPFCLTPAYFTLVPAYGALFLAGRVYAGMHRERIATLLPLAGVFLGGVVLCELFSSGGFYLFSGYFTDPSWAQYLERTLTYFPSFLSTTLLYLGLAVLAHGFVRACFGGTEGQSAKARAS